MRLRLPGLTEIQRFLEGHALERKWMLVIENTVKCINNTQWIKVNEETLFHVCFLRWASHSTCLEEKFYLDHLIHGRHIKALTCSTWSSDPPQILTKHQKEDVINKSIIIFFSPKHFKWCSSHRSVFVDLKSYLTSRHSAGTGTLEFIFLKIQFKCEFVRNKTLDWYLVSSHLELHSCHVECGRAGQDGGVRLQ